MLPRLTRNPFWIEDDAQSETPDVAEERAFVDEDSDASAKMEEAAAQPADDTDDFVAAVAAPTVAATAVAPPPEDTQSDKGESCAVGCLRYGLVILISGLLGALVALAILLFLNGTLEIGKHEAFTVVRSQLETFANDVANVTGLAQENASAVGELDTKVDTTIAQVEQLSTQLGTLSEQTQSLGEQLLTVEQDVEALEEMISGVQEDIFILNEQVLRLDEQDAVLETEIEALSGEIALVQAEVEAINLTIDQLNMTAGRFDRFAEWSESAGRNHRRA